MSSKILSGIAHKDGYTYALEDEILGWFREALFAPLLLVLANYRVPVSDQYEKTPDYARSNSVTAAVPSAVIAALETNRIHYANGVFSGVFDAPVSRELKELGAVWRHSDKTFRITETELPDSIKGQTVTSAENGRALHAELIAVAYAILANVRPQVTLGIRIRGPMSDILADLKDQLGVEVQGLPASITQGAFSAAEHYQAGDALEDEHERNIDQAVKRHLERVIPKMAERLTENEQQGARTDKAAQIVEDTLGQTKRKAHGIANQESITVTSGFAEVTANGMGSNRYVWQTMRDHRVRPTWDYPDGDHRSLEGKTFFWSSPPVTVPRNGHTAHPGEDQNCRCKARPIIDYIDLSEVRP